MSDKLEIGSLLHGTPFSFPLDHCTLLKGGANNRVYLLESIEKEKFIMKHYFHHPKDERKRLESEYTFLSYAWNKKIRSIPEPLFFDREKNIGIYSFIEGSPIEKVTEKEVQDAIVFFLSLNEGTQDKNLPRASESCFSFFEYEKILVSRLERLRKEITPIDSLHEEAQAFVNNHLLPLWVSLQKKYASRTPLPPLSQEELCINPSDFGFHNALSHQKQTYFIDFEYAGWDDPAKMLCDFFCQPKIPVPWKHADTWLRVLSKTYPNAIERAKMVFPLMQMKWCTIILNCFLPVGKERRAFAGVSQKNALEIAKNLLKKIQTGETPWPI